MPRLNNSSNLQEWFHVCALEQYERYETTEDKQAFINGDLYSPLSLRNWGNSTIYECLMDEMENPNEGFIKAIMNSVDWKELHTDLVADLVGQCDNDTACAGCGVGEDYDCRSSCPFKHSPDTRPEVSRW